MELGPAGARLWGGLDARAVWIESSILARRPDTAACTDWLTKVCSAATGDGAVEPAADDGGVVDPEAVVNGGVPVVPVADGEEMGPEAVVPDEPLETGVVAILGNADLRKEDWNG